MRLARKYLKPAGLALAAFHGAAAVLLLAAPAWGCAVCFEASQGQREAYYGTAALLTLLPFVLFGSFGYWFYRTLKKGRESDIPSNSQDSPPRA